MRKDRLLKLADYLETVPRKKFDISGWGYETKKCGFAGCAMGWAGFGRLFRGLKFERGDLHYAPEPHLGNDGFSIAQSLFGIDGEASRYLFSYRFYPDGETVTPKRVSKRIRSFVAEKSPSGV